MVNNVSTSGENVNRTFYSGSKFRQYYSAFAANLAVTSLGAALSWTSTAFPDINSSHGGQLDPLTSTEESWITSVVFLGAIFACPLSGFLIGELGTRASMLTLTAPLIGGWLLIIFSKNFWMLLIGRFITGFAAGGAALAAPVFVAETAEIEIRGMLGFGFNILSSFGQLYIFIVGSLVSWQWQAAACGMMPILFHALLTVVPESPRTLVSKNKLDESKKSLAWFRQAKTLDLIDEEFNSILESIEATKTEKFQLKDYLSPDILRPTLICINLTFFLQITGAPAILAHTVDIFEAAGVDNNNLAAILIGLTLLLMAIPAALCVDRLGRRVLLISSAASMAISQAALGCYMYWKEEIFAHYNWIPLICLMIFMAGFAIGIGPVPFVLMGEMVPAAAKGASSAAIMLLCRVFAFIVLFVYNDLVAVMSAHGLYWFFSGASITTLCYVYLYVPETKGKSLDEIRQIFEPKVENKYKTNV